MTQPNSFIGLAFVIDEKRKLDAGFLAEKLGIARIAQSDGGQASAFFAKLLFELAQLRDMLTAENSAVMAEKNNDRRRIGPQRTQPDCFAIDIRQRDARELGAISLSHGASFSWA